MWLNLIFRQKLRQKKKTDILILNVMIKNLFLHLHYSSVGEDVGRVAWGEGNLNKSNQGKIIGTSEYVGHVVLGTFSHNN